MESSLSSQLLNQYLQQQAGTATSEDTNGGAIKAVEFPDDAIFKEFKNHVKLWMEIDNMIRKLKEEIGRAHV